MQTTQARDAHNHAADSTKQAHLMGGEKAVLHVSGEEQCSHFHKNEQSPHEGLTQNKHRVAVETDHRRFGEMNTAGAREYMYRH